MQRLQLRPHPPMSRAMRRSATPAAALLAVAALLACVRAGPPVVSGPGLVALIVLDTVRADHLSLCGYPRPTSPRMDELARTRARWSCDAYSPGTWTLPSHASFFTGVPVPEHGADFSPGGENLLWDVRVRPLGPRLPTLAQMMARAGYRSLAVSANPVISEATGLARGFHELVGATSFGELYGERLIHALDRALARQPADQPLFLFLNISDAHHPWRAIPDDVNWLPARPGMTYGIKSPESPWRRYMAGELERTEAEALAAHNTDLYDWGIRRADDTLAAALALLEERGHLRAGYRIVITSDHGEFLGQHGLMGHCCYAYEAVTRVPFLVLTSGSSPELPRPLAALQAHHFLRDGHLAAGDGVVTSVGYPSANLHRHVGRLGHELSVALWRDHEKLHWIEGRVARYALDADPREQAALDAAGHPLVGYLEAVAQDARRSGSGDHEPGEREAVRHLQALGYVE
jgi:hypothetical protein